MTRFLLATTLALALLGAPALAIDPECDPSAPGFVTPYDPASGAYAADQNFVRFCTPRTDTRGEALSADAIDRCDLEVTDPADGSTTTYARATGVGPAEAVRIAVDARTRGTRTLRLYCSSTAGAGEAQTAEATFPGVRPAVPALLPATGGS